MATVTQTQPQAEDLFSVGSRVSWSAILAGAAVALAIQFLLGVLGATVAWSTSDRVNTSTMQNGSAIWTVLATCVAMFAGGMVTALLTTGENKVEAALYGIVMWAAVVAVIAHGASAGAGLLSDSTATLHTHTSRGWESGAREAGVTDAQIEEWRSKTAAKDRTETRTTDGADVATNRAIWYAFGGIWLSMIAATGGALFGAGPTFRLVTTTRRGSPVM